MEELNILYTTDRNYFRYMITSLYSLLENNKDLKLNIHIIYEGFTEEEFNLTNRIIASFPNSRVIYHPFDKARKEIEKYNIPNWRDTKIANARIFFSSILKDVKNMLYLDSDTLVVGSLKGLLNADGAVNMVKDLLPREKVNELGIPIKNYCNSGVFYINMDKWYRDDCDKLLVDTLSHKSTSYNYPDQDIINISLRDEIALLHPKYNLFSIDTYYKSMLAMKLYDRKNRMETREDEKKMAEAKKSPVILHATPLCFLKEHRVEEDVHPYNKIYCNYRLKVDGKVIETRKISMKEKMFIDTGLYTKLVVPSIIRTKVKKKIKKEN